MWPTASSLPTVRAGVETDSPINTLSTRRHCHATAARDPRTAATPEIARSVAALSSETEQHAARAEALALLGFEAEGQLCNAAISGHALGQVLEKLMTLSDAQVLSLVAVLAAETLPVGAAIIDPLGETLGADVAKHWQPDATLFNLVRGRAVVEAMAIEVLGPEAAPKAMQDTLVSAKALIAEVAKTKATGWRPRWLAFPMGSYHDTQAAMRQAPK